jgi:4-amino-4-deoxy-L-arabinose transferase-like glycosyltransferase
MRWELYVGLSVQAAVILTWVWFVYAGQDGPEHLKVFFWNNLVGRFAHIDAPQELQYAAGHRNSPGKYLLELPMYLWPWTLLVAAAARRAFRLRHMPFEQTRPVRFALASFLPALAVLSVAATARNIYLAPALPGAALLLGWWARETVKAADRWDVYALRGTAVLLLLAALVFVAALALLGADASGGASVRFGFVAISALGLIAAAGLVLHALAATRRGQMASALAALLLAYCALLAGPASQVYRVVDSWQNLQGVARAIAADARGRPLILMAPDETTRAMIDMYARTSVGLIAAPINSESLVRLQEKVANEPQAYMLVQLPGRNLTPALQRIAKKLRSGAGHARDSVENAPPWAASSQLRTAHLYAVPNGRRYALLERAP